MVACFLVPDRRARLVFARVGIGVSILFAVAQGRAAWADKIRSILTERDLAHPTILTASGQAVSSSTRGETAAGTPTYVAYALMGGEHLPSDLTTLYSTTGSGTTTTGPLAFTPALETSLGSALASSGEALVQTSGQEYLISYLPRYAQESSGSSGGGQASASSNSASSGSSATSSSATSWNVGPLSVNNINGIPVSQISSLFKTGTKDLTTVTSSAVGDLGRLLDLNNAHRSAMRPSLNLAIRTSSATGQQEAQVLEVPAPEPGTWVVFAVLLGAAGARERLRRRKTGSPLAGCPSGGKEV